MSQSFSYFQAAYITQLAYMTAKGLIPYWVSGSSSFMPSLLYWNFDVASQWVAPPIFYPTLSHSLAVWDRQRAWRCLSFFHNPEFPTELLPHQFHCWANKGHFLNDNKLYTLAHYRYEMQIPSSETFHYNQIISYIQSMIKSSSIPLTLTFFLYLETLVI